MKNKEAVSEVIGVVLLLGITLVLASVMFLWVSSIVLQSSSAPVGDISIEKERGGLSTVNYTVTINSFRPKTDPKDIVCYFYDGVISKGRFDLLSPGNSSTVNVTGDDKIATLTWHGDGNMVSSYDTLKIIILGLTDDDKKVLSSYSFALRYRPDGALIAQTDLS